MASRIIIAITFLSFINFCVGCTIVTVPIGEVVQKPKTKILGVKPSSEIKSIFVKPWEAIYLDTSGVKFDTVSGNFIGKDYKGDSISIPSKNVKVQKEIKNSLILFNSEGGKVNLERGLIIGSLLNSSLYEIPIEDTYAVSINKWNSTHFIVGTLLAGGIIFLLTQLKDVRTFEVAPGGF